MSGFPLPFALLLAFLAAQRLAELVYSKRNLTRYSDRAADAERPRDFALMVALHVGLIVCPALEVLWKGEGAAPVLMWTAIGAFVLAQLIRYWAIAALGKAWNQRAVVDPQNPIVTTGPYRFVRHPNYLAILLEFVSVPAAGAAWISLVALNLLHVPIIVRRIAAEERLLVELPGYREAMRGKARLLPGLF